MGSAIEIDICSYTILYLYNYMWVCDTVYGEKPYDGKGEKTCFSLVLVTTRWPFCWIIKFSYIYLILFTVFEIISVYILTRRQVPNWIFILLNIFYLQIFAYIWISTITRKFHRKNQKKKYNVKNVCDKYKKLKPN